MDPTRIELRAFLRRVGLAVAEGRVFVSAYAIERAADDLEWDQWDIVEQLKELVVVSFHRA